MTNNEQKKKILYLILRLVYSFQQLDKLKGKDLDRLYTEITHDKVVCLAL